MNIHNKNKELAGNNSKSLVNIKKSIQENNRIFSKYSGISLSPLTEHEKEEVRREKLEDNPNDYCVCNDSIENVK